MDQTVITVFMIVMCFLLLTCAGVIFVMCEQIKRLRKQTEQVKMPEEKPGKVERRKIREFSKFMIALYAFACIAWIQQDYILAFLYQQPVNSSVTVTLAGTVVVALLGYFSKSYLEKNSRNVNGVAEDGTFIPPTDRGGEIG